MSNRRSLSGARKRAPVTLRTAAVWTAPALPVPEDTVRLKQAYGIQISDDIVDIRRVAHPSACVVTTMIGVVLLQKSRGWAGDRLDRRIFIGRGTPMC